LQERHPPNRLEERGGTSQNAARTDLSIELLDQLLRAAHAGGDTPASKLLPPSFGGRVDQFIISTLAVDIGCIGKIDTKKDESRPNRLRSRSQ